MLHPVHLYQGNRTKPISGIIRVIIIPKLITHFHQILFQIRPLPPEIRHHPGIRETRCRKFSRGGNHVFCLVPQIIKHFNRRHQTSIEQDKLQILLVERNCLCHIPRVHLVRSGIIRTETPGQHGFGI